MGNNEDLSRKCLSQKLALLMALVQASRTSELQALDLRFRVYKPSGVSFKLASLTKKRTPGLPPKELFFGAFSKDKHLCVVECLKQYKKVTEGIRSRGSDTRPLFLSYTRPYGPVTSQRIAHWIKDLLAKAGIDTGVFKAHSVRSASTTAAECSSWCATRKVNPFSCGVEFFLDFLAELYEQGLQHRSINTIRSAVSTTHKQIEGVPLG